MSLVLIYSWLRTEGTKKRLLTEKKLTFESALELAQSLETTLKDAQQEKDEASGFVHNAATPKRGKVACYITVARRSTRQVSVRLKKLLATTCGKNDHINAAFRSKRQPQCGKRQFHRRKGSTQWVDAH